MKRAAIYLRVSTQEQKQHGISINSQEDALLKYCEEQDYTVVGIYNDAGISARKRYTKRPELLRLLDDCKRNRIDIILFTKLDRWFRSVADYYEVQTVLDQHKVKWRAIWEDYETETSAGVFKVNIMLSVAQSEADRTSERIKAVNEYRREQGKYIGGEPTGYKKQGGHLIINEETHDAVQAFFSTYVATKSMMKSREAALAKGLNIKKATAIHMLHNTVYYGDLNGYKTVPYITKEEYDSIQNAMSNWARPRSTGFGDNYIFSGMLTCPYCGGKMIAKATAYHLDGVPEKVWSFGYQCGHRYNDKASCRGFTICQRKVEKRLLAKLREDIGVWKIEGEAVEDVADHTDEIRNLRAKLKRITILYEDGDITIEDYRIKRDSLKTQIETLERPVANVARELPDNWEEVYQELDFVHRRSFWSEITRKITIGKDNVDIQYR